MLPDAPEEPGAVAVAGAPGRLTAAAVREVWPEIVTAIGRQSKKVSALAAGATVRDLDGQTVVLTFRYPAHARMLAPEAPLIASALYEALGGEWEVRCEVAGEAGAIAPEPPGGSEAQHGPDGPRAAGSQRASETRRSTEAQRVSAGAQPTQPTQQAPASVGREPQSRRRAAETPSSGDDDWPEPAKPGGPATPDTDAEEDWPEVSPIGPAEPVAAPGGGAGPAEPVAAPGGGAGPAGPVAAPGGGAGSPETEPPGVGGRAQPVDLDRGARGNDGRSRPGVGAASDQSSAAGGTAGMAVPREPAPSVSGGGTADGTGAPARSGAGPERGSGAVGEGSPRTGRNVAPGSGLAAARAAAAGARLATARPTAKPAWSDGSPTEEAPYDGDYDGFDPGDEPLDDVIDEKTARESSEQQAMRLLQDAFGAEKIGES